MTRRFSLSVSRFATAAVSVAVAGAIVLSTPQSGAAQVTSGSHYTGGVKLGTEVTLTQCDLAKTKAPGESHMGSELLYVESPGKEHILLLIKIFRKQICSKNSFNLNFSSAINL